jgi:hypothetical protein
VTAAGDPVAGAQLSLWGHEREVRTSDSGAFVVPAVSGGSSTLDVRSVGFESARGPVDLRTGAGQANTLEVFLARATTKLAPVTILDRRVSSVLVRSGFDTWRTGEYGKFVDAEALEKMNVANASEAIDIDLLVVPGDIAGIEIYRRAAQAPLQCAGTTPDACGVIVIWRTGIYEGTDRGCVDLRVWKMKSQCSGRGAAMGVSGHKGEAKLRGAPPPTR